jgi:hypothetical protein
MKPFLIIALFLLAGAAAGLRADDEVRMKDGTTRKGQVVGMDENSFRLTLPGPMPGQSAGTTSIPRANVERIIFEPDRTLEAIRANPGPGALNTARVRWKTLQPMLAIPESRAGDAGNLYGECLRLSGESSRREEALGVFAEVEQGAWNPSDRENAKRGRLRTMIDLGRSQEVAAEIEQLATSAQDPDLLLDSKLLIASARLAAMQTLVADNPRWHEDPPVRAERLRLLHETADNALYPFLFHGTARVQAAKGLGILLELYQFTGDDEEARKVAPDLTEIYSDSPEAKKAAEFLKKKTEKS